MGRMKVNPRKSLFPGLQKSFVDGQVNILILALLYPCSTTTSNYMGVDFVYLTFFLFCIFDKPIYSFLLCLDRVTANKT